MKKIIACLSLALAMSASMTAMAAGTANESDKTVTISGADAYKTVLIKNNTTGDIVFVDQATDAVSATANYLIASDAVEGAYTAYLGGNGTAVQTIAFTIAADAPAAEDEAMVPLSKVEGDSTYDMGFTVDAVNLSDYGYIAITATKGDASATAYVSFEEAGWTTVTDADVNVAVKVTNIANDVDNVAVALTATNNYGGVE